MSCITQLLALKGGKEFFPINNSVVIEGGGIYKDYEFLITFVEHGNRCGYVAIPSGITYDSYEINIHGGITFESKEHAAKNLLSIPCDDMWLGFDAAHYLDMGDFETAKKYFGENADLMLGINLREQLDQEVGELERQDPNFSHKTFDYMVNECKSLIDQLIEQAA